MPLSEVLRGGWVHFADGYDKLTTRKLRWQPPPTLTPMGHWLLAVVRHGIVLRLGYWSLLLHN